MEPYLINLFYISLILLLGVILTVISSKLRLSNILFLILAGYALKMMQFNFFGEEIILVLSALAIVVMALEATLRVDVAHLLKEFLPVLRFTFIHFALCVYALTLAVFLLFDFPAKDFNTLVLCMLLSVLMYGTDATIATEFLQGKKGKATEILGVEGIISSPLVALFSFFLIDYLNSHSSTFSVAVLGETGVFVGKVAAALVVSAVLAWMAHSIVRFFEMSSELKALFIITTGIGAYVVGEVIRSDGSFAVAFFGLWLRAFAKERISNVYNTVLAHTIYIILFIALGMQLSLPPFGLWLKGLALFGFYMLIRFTSTLLFLKGTTLGEKAFITLNASKGIEVAVVLFIFSVSFKEIPALQMIASLGFLMLLFSYVVATAANHYSDAFLEGKTGKKIK